MKRDVWPIYEGIVNSVAVALFGAMVVVTTMGVFYRYVLNNALPHCHQGTQPPKCPCAHCGGRLRFPIIAKPTT